MELLQKEELSKLLLQLREYIFRKHINGGGEQVRLLCE